MNRTNKSSIEPVRGPVPGSGPGSGTPVTNIRGGVLQKSAMFCYIADIRILLFLCFLPATTGPNRSDSEESGRTIATPPFLPLYRQPGRGFVTGFVTYPVHPLLGSLSSDLSLREGSERTPNPKRALTRRRQAP